MMIHRWAAPGMRSFLIGCAGAGRFTGLIALIFFGALMGARGAGEFETGQYRNLFVEAGHSPVEVSNRVAAVFGQLFHGNPRSQAVYFEAGTNGTGPLAFISDVNSKDVRSEGM